MDQSEFSFMALLLNTAVLMALLGFLLGKGQNIHNVIGRWEKAGLIVVMAILAMPMALFGQYDQVTIAAIFLSVVVCVCVLLVGTDKWFCITCHIRRLRRPVVESYMLSLDDIGIKVDESVPGMERGAVWVYANNAGKGKARSVRIDTNIPNAMVNSSIWQDGTISRSIEVLDPQMPVCIGVVKPTKDQQEPYWISFEYVSEMNTTYRERYELDL